MRCGRASALSSPSNQYQIVTSDGSQPRWSINSATKSWPAANFSGRRVNTSALRRGQASSRQGMTRRRAAIIADDARNPACSDGDLTLDGGEQASLVVTVENRGAADASAVDVVLSTPEREIVFVNGSRQALPGLAAGASAEVVYELLAGDLGCATSVPFQVEVQAPENLAPDLTGFALLTEQDLVIGMVGFKGPPDADGMVEIAYGIVPQFEGRGFATEAAGAATEWAFDSGVRTVRAHTKPEPNASTRVLSHCGFEFRGDAVDPADGPVWRWERPKQRFT